MSKNVTIKLVEPIEQGNETITEIVLVKPKGKHFKKLPMEPVHVSDLWPFTCAICNQPPSVLDELVLEDFMKLMEEVGNFIPDGLGIGGK
jgi:hypothetical protein